MMAEGNGNNRIQWAFASRGFLASAIPQAKLTIMKNDVSVNIISEKKLNCTSLGSWKNSLIKICLCLLSSLHVRAKPSGKILLQERQIPLKTEEFNKKLIAIKIRTSSCLRPLASVRAQITGSSPCCPWSCAGAGAAGTHGLLLWLSERILLAQKFSSSPYTFTCIYHLRAIFGP